MTKQQEDSIWKWAAGIAITIVIGLLGGILTISINSNERMLDFQENNYKEHKLLIEQNSEQYNWSHSVYQYEIQPNTVRSKSNEKRLNIVERKIR